MIKSILLVADTFVPSRSSAALQLKDLANEFLLHGITPTVVTSDSRLQGYNSITELDGISILRLKTPEHKNIKNFRRALAEVLMPFFMIKNFRMSSLRSNQWDAVVWYSPTIFLGPFIWYLKRKNTSLSYLILRDIFPAWALDLGLIRKGFFYYIFRLFEKFQYSIADVIGVQSIGNLSYFKNLNCQRIEVLQNWLTAKPLLHCSVSITTLPIANRKIFIYAGNMGVAQGVGDLLDLAGVLLDRSDIGFLFIGRGSDLAILRTEAKNRNLFNTVFLDEIGADEIPSLYAQCKVGLIALDARHKTHNIPGKFLSYLQSGLPVMAIVNEGNDLLSIIERYRVGKVTTDRSFNTLRLLAESLIQEIDSRESEISARCKKLSSELFSSNAAVEKIVQSLNLLR